MSRADATAAEDAWRLLNQMRKAAGLRPLDAVEALARAAAGHARYLVRNAARGHRQRGGKPGFTGASAADRARRAGYPHGEVSEAIAQGAPTAQRALASLFAGIYHRLALLAFDRDEGGAAFLRDAEGGERLVINQGHGPLAGLFAHPPPEARFSPPGQFVVASPGGPRVRADVYTAVRQSVARGQPRCVLWPPPGATGVPPAFFEEHPHPLPGHQVTGYPVSVQFNPVFAGSARLESMRLYCAPAGGARAAESEVRPVRTIHAANDAHGLLSPLEFALFPLHRLPWGARCRVHACFRVDGQREELDWSFTTRDLGLPLYEVAARGETLPVRAGVEYALYLPPTRTRPVLASFAATAESGAEPLMAAEDGNTLRVTVEGRLCSRVRFSLPDGAGFTLRLAASDNTEREHPPEVLYAACSEYTADFKVRARGERLVLEGGRAYRLYFPDETAGDLTLRHPSSVQPRVAWEDAHTLRVQLRGAGGETVEFLLPGGRRFSATVAPREAPAPSPGQAPPRGTAPGASRRTRR